MSTRETKQREVDANCEFFKNELPNLLEKHRGKYALIRNREIIGFYDTIVDAQKIGTQLYDDGIFSVQQVTDAAIDLGFYSHAVHLGAA
jgi:Family of unknown function (DUF5678)